MIVFYAALSAFMVYLCCLLEVRFTLNVEVSRGPTGHVQFTSCALPTCSISFCGKNIQAAIMFPLKHKLAKKCVVKKI